MKARTLLEKHIAWEENRLPQKKEAEKRKAAHTQIELYVLTTKQQQTFARVYIHEHNAPLKLRRIKRMEENPSQINHLLTKRYAHTNRKELETNFLRGLNPLEPTTSQKNPHGSRNVAQYFFPECASSYVLKVIKKLR